MISENLRIDTFYFGDLGLLLLTWINFNSSKVSDNLPSEVRDEITYPIQNFSGYAVDVSK